MSRGRPRKPLELSEEGRTQLESLASSGCLRHRLVQPVQIVLACAEGATHTAVAEAFGVSKTMVGQWQGNGRL